MFPPRPSRSPALSTFAGAGIAVALATHIGAPAQPLPASVASVLDRPSDADLIVVTLPAGVAVAETERSWALPSRDALVRGRLDEISILAHDAGDAVCWHTRRPGLWQRVRGRGRHRDLAAELAAAART